MTTPSSTPSSAPKILIVGAGLAGSLLAVLLAREGFRVSVYERRPDPRVKGYVGGRSINLALSVRGIDALEFAGLAERVMAQDAIPMRGRMMHPVQGSLAYQPYSADPEDAINSVSRGGLNLTLLNAAGEYPNVELVFDRFHLETGPLERGWNTARFAKVSGGGLPKPDAPTEEVTADLILGADGAFSTVRSPMLKTDRYDYSQSYLSHSYKELHIPPKGGLGPSGEYAMDPHALHIWPRGGAMMIALPNRDRSFTCTLFWPREGEHSFGALRTREETLAFFRKFYPDAVPLMPTLAEDFEKNPTSALVTVRCFPWHIEGKAAILGDAAHAVVPFYGQGMNCAFEDCKALVQCLRRHGADAGRGTLGDAVAALEEFQHLRKPNADAIADMALDNFLEMRDKVGSPAFLYRKRVEQTLHRLFPEKCEPQYHLVSFSTVPYAEARRRGRELDGMYDEVIAGLPAGSEKTLGDQAWLERVRAAGSRWLERHAEAAVGSAATPEDGRALIDISPPLTPDIKVWPGDTPMTREVLCEIAKGANITLSTLRGTVHLGSHADGPNHYVHPGRSVGEQKLEHYVGPCQVVDTRARRGERLTLADLLTPIQEIAQKRVLLRTGTCPDPNNWPEDFTAISVELVDALAARGVITLGVDTPSVDLFSSKDLPAHKAISRHDIAILEGLQLGSVTPGVYELIALPLKLMGFDGSPVRAVLRGM